MVSANRDPSRTFATADAPYIDYLTGIKGRWDGAMEFESELKSLAQIVKRDDKPISPNHMPGPRSTLAEILDVRCGIDSKMCIPKLENRPFLMVNHQSPVPPRDEVERFLGHLSVCEPDVHTRIIVFNSERSLPGDSAASSLFFCHVLGEELDLPLADVQILSQVGNLSDSSLPVARWPYLHSMKPGFLSLGPLSPGITGKHLQKRTVAAYVGQRNFGSSSPHVVVVHLQDGRYDSRLPWGPVGCLWEPPSRSQCTRNTQMGAPRLTSLSLFLHALNRSFETSNALEDNQRTGSWLSALIYMDAMLSANELDTVVSDRLKLLPDKVEDISNVRERLSQIRASLQASENQIAAFRSTHPFTRYSDYHDAHLFLARLLNDAKALAENIKESFDTQHQLKNIQVSTLAVNETRSAIALTILAFVFIPINLASSLYGMNVQEINETGHSIWGFVVTALTLLACSGLGWALWRAAALPRSKARGRSLANRFRRERFQQPEHEVSGI